HAAPPPAGTAIGNQASATYTDTSGISRSVTSNVVQTIVQQVASLTLTGNGSDSFNLTAVNGSGFNMSGIQIFADNGSGQPTGPALTSSGPLAAGAAFKFIVVATVPTSATAGQTNTLSVTATSVFNAALNAANTDTTTVTNNAVISVTK